MFLQATLDKILGKKNKVKFKEQSKIRYKQETLIPVFASLLIDITKKSVLEETMDIRLYPHPGLRFF